MEKWDPVPGPSEPPGPTGTLCDLEIPSNLWDPLGLPEPSGTIGISWNVMHGKDFSGIRIIILCLKNYNFSIVKMSQF